MFSVSADKLKIISAPFNARIELGGIGAHTSSHISIPKQTSAHSNTARLFTGTD